MLRWSIPPFTIFIGKQHINTWYKDESSIEDWRIIVSLNGWTTNKLSLKWLKHFNAHIKARVVGTHQLLIINGYKSHNSLNFRNYYKEANIITLYMPAHLLHLL